MRSVVAMIALVTACGAREVTPGGSGPDNGLWDASADAVLDTTPDISNDVSTTGPLHASAIFVGNWQTLAILDDGTLAGWGAVPDGITPPPPVGGFVRPVRLDGFTNVFTAAPSLRRSCVVESDGSLACWGNNYLGEATGTPSNESVPITRVPGAQDAAAVATGTYIACVMQRSNGVTCWGALGVWTRNGGCESEPTVSDAHAAQRVDGIANVTRLAGGGASMCALESDGSVHCWGCNDHGQLGDGTLAARPDARVVTGLNDAVEIGFDGTSACARTRTGDVLCWGAGTWGAGPMQSMVPVRVNVPASDRIVVGGGTMCSHAAGAGWTCWGNAYQPTSNGCAGYGPNAPRVMPALSNFVDLALDDGHGCGRTADGAVECWGCGAEGQLGDGTMNYSDTPVAVAW